MKRRSLALLFSIALSSALVSLTGCGGAAEPSAPVVSPTEERAATPVTLTVVGTNDLHGHVRALPILGGYLRVLREARAEDGGAVVLIDGGDMFQGTLESNLLEGAPVVEAYSALGYDAVTIGNHEFDYGPVGSRATPASPDEDPRGALRARAAEASFPFLSANLTLRESGEPPDWENVAPAVMIERAGVRIGIIGVTTEDTLTTTLAANVRDLAIASLAASIAREARALRDEGAAVVIVAAHAGGHCTDLSDPHDLGSCEADQEIHRVAAELPGGVVDVIVAGHTHRAMAHVVGGIAIIESYSYGRAFGRVDLRVDPDARRVVNVRVHPPRELCEAGSADEGDCRPGRYEARAVVPDASVARLLAPAIANAREARERPLGVEIETAVTRDREGESALGNLFTDLMRSARPEADVALTNGGGLRADLPAGPLTYGALYESSPFDNRFAFVRMSGRDLRTVVAENLQRSGSFFSLSGVRAEARCEGDTLEVRLRRDDGRPIRDGEALRVVTTDFLADGGDGAFGEITAREGAVTIEDGEPVRDAMADVLRRRDGTLSGAALFDPARPRVRYPGERPIRCP